MDDYLLIRLFIQLVFALICVAIANSKGRSALGWFFGGFFLGIIGLVIVACLSNKKEEDAKERRMQNEQRRLREQLRQERMRNETFQRYAAERLDAHDEHLHIDTRSADAPRQLAEESSAGGDRKIQVRRSTLSHAQDVRPVFNADAFQDDDVVIDEPLAADEPWEEKGDRPSNDWGSTRG